MDFAASTRVRASRGAPDWLIVDSVVFITTTACIGKRAPNDNVRGKVRTVLCAHFAAHRLDNPPESYLAELTQEDSLRPLLIRADEL